MSRSVAAVAVLTLAGCFPSGDYECDFDADCSSGEVCARTHECALASEVRAVRIDWMLAGQADTQTGCPALGLTDLTIQFTGSDDSTLTFAPVPCNGGSYFMDKLPVRFSSVALSGNADTGASYYGETIVGADPEYSITLTQF